MIVVEFVFPIEDLMNLHQVVSILILIFIFPSLHRRLDFHLYRVPYLVCWIDGSAAPIAREMDHIKPCSSPFVNRCF